MKTIKTVVTLAFIASLVSAALVFWLQPPHPALTTAGCSYAATACAQQLAMTHGWPRLY